MGGRGRRTSSAWRRRGIALALLLVGLTGCAGLPTDGPVREVGEQSFTAPAEEPAVRRLAPPPRDGASPEEIVRGFLLASAGTEENSSTARRYLTAAAAEEWKPDRGVVILDDYPSLRATGASVRMVGRQVATIDGQNRYVSQRPARPVSVTFELRGDPRARGEFRIASLPDGVYLPRYEVDRVYRSLDAFYLTPAQDRLVPEPIALASSDALPAHLMRRLLRGPGDLLKPAVTNALPADATLEDGSVPMRGGVADVRLSVPEVDDDLNREALLAQVAYTLKQVPGLTAVRVALNGDVIDIPGTRTPQPVDAWDRFDPEVLQSSATRPYAVVSGRVGVLQDDGFTALPGGAGTRRLDLRMPAINLDASEMAAVSSDGERLYWARIGAAEQPVVRVRGRALFDPSFDLSGSLWVLDAGSSRDGIAPTLWMAPPGGRAARVALPTMGSARPREMRVSRDGLSIAFIARDGEVDKLYVATLLPAAKGVRRVGRATEIAPRFTAIRDVAWRDARTLAVLGVEPGSVPQPYVLSADGFATEVLSPVPANVVTITAAPGGAPLLVGADGPVVFEASGRTWRERAQAADPVYPG